MFNPPKRTALMSRITDSLQTRNAGRHIRIDAVLIGMRKRLHVIAENPQSVTISHPNMNPVAANQLTSPEKLLSRELLRQGLSQRRPLAAVRFQLHAGKEANCRTADRPKIIVNGVGCSCFMPVCKIIVAASPFMSGTRGRVG